MMRKPGHITGWVTLLLLPAIIGWSAWQFSGTAAFRDWQIRQQNSWRKSFDPKSKHAYGTYVLFEMLKRHFDPDFTVLKDSLQHSLPASGSSSQPANYVFLGEELDLDSAGAEALVDFISQGNQATIISNGLPYTFTQYWLSSLDTCEENYYWLDYFPVFDTAVTIKVNGLETPYRFHHRIRNRLRLYEWQYLGDIEICGALLEHKVLATMNDSVPIFAEFPIGYGKLYLHTVPLTFTNYFAVTPAGFEYLTESLQHLGKGPVYWDQFNHMVWNGPSSFSPPNKSIGTESPLEYILSQPSLTWAWYIIVALGLFYLLFRTKRQQRIIPVLRPNTNTSLEFISTIGRLYFLQDNHKMLCQLKMKLFLASVRDHYHLATDQLDEQFVQKLAAKSEVKSEVLKKIVTFHQNISKSQFVSDKTLAEFQRLFEHYYQNRI